jgi:translation initiation factor IF-3
MPTHFISLVVKNRGEFLSRYSKKEEKTSGPRINQNIRVPKVLVIDENGEQLGQMTTRDALQLAGSRGLDLIEVAANAKPPVCRFADFGKMMYEKKKKDSKAKKNSTVIKVKEVKLTPSTGVHDFEVKRKQAEKFLEKGDKVKIIIRFRGREMAHKDQGEIMCKRIFEVLREIAEIEVRPRMDGRQMTMIIAPIRTK